MKPYTVLIALGAAVSWTSAIEIGLAQKPEVTFHEGTAIVRFTAEATTDVEVAILNSEGTVVRHLVAGMLGPRAPEPLIRGALAQTVVWDGKDDLGSPLPKGTYHVRVRLGLQPKFERVVEWEPPSLASRGVIAFSVDEHGNIYAINVSLWEGRGGGHTMFAWDRNGKYLRQLMPFRRDLPLTRVPGVKFTTLPTGEQVPNTVYFPPLISTRFVMRAQDGRLTMFGFPMEKEESERGVHLVRIMTSDGGAPPEGYLGPAVPGLLGKRFPAYLAISPDGQTLYVSGTGEGSGRVSNIIYKGKWTDKTLAVFIGKDAGLSDPRGIATDPEGRLYVCDFNHDRIAVFDSNGKQVQTIPVQGPEQVEIDPKTRALYVYSVRDDAKREERKSLMYENKALVKLTAKGKQVAALELPRRARHMHDAGPLLALDTSGPEPVIYISYVGRQEPGDYLWKVIDRDTKLERVDPPVGRYYWPFVRAYNAMAVDPVREEVYLGGRSFPGLLRMNGMTGELMNMEKITREIYGNAAPVSHPQITGLAVDSHGRIYVRLMGTWSSYQNWIRRYDRDGMRVPFSNAPKVDDRNAAVLAEVGLSSEGDLVVTQPSRGYHSGGLAVAANGDMYVIEKALNPATGQPLPGNANTLNVYGPDGSLKKAGIVPWLSAGAWGPRLDAKGNIYLTDAIRPNQPQITSETTGSLVKYNSTGAEVKFDETGEFVTRRNERDLPATRLVGTNWVYYGVGLTAFGHCVCSACQFDLDGFGRAALPDVNRFRVKIVDSGGNFITSFGEYGNRDSAGPASAVPIPPIPLWEPNAVGFSDRAIYVYDRRNHRILCVRLDARTAETVTVTLP